MTILVNIISNDLYQITNKLPEQLYIHCRSKYIRYYFKLNIIAKLNNMYPDKKDIIATIFKKPIQYANICKNSDEYINKYDVIIL